MNDLLFDIPEYKSPRLKWMEANCIRTYHNPDRSKPWQALTWNREKPQEEITEFGMTEDDAIVALCKRIGLRLWNEVNAAAPPRCPDRSGANRCPHCHFPFRFAENLKCHLTLGCPGASPANTKDMPHKPASSDCSKI